jgi:hypothetical protein
MSLQTIPIHRNTLNSTLRHLRHFRQAQIPKLRYKNSDTEAQILNIINQQRVPDGVISYEVYKKQYNLLKSYKKFITFIF